MSEERVRIRLATTSEADAISRMIVRTLRETSAADYSAEVIAALVGRFSPEAVVQRMHERQVLVALTGSDLVGTAALQGALVRTVFVDPDWQRQGIGSRLMRTIEALATDVAALTVNASVTAEGFYCRLGFVRVREQVHDGERTIVMMKPIQWQP
jgi:N-acetylglutamate synthase-like GNAT family acetyltransferase